MEPEDLSALVEAGEVHEEDLIEPSLSQELSWKRSHVVGGGDHEHPRGAVLHPSQEPSQKPMAGAPVSLVPCRSIPPTESRVTAEGTTSSASPESSRSAFAVWRKATSVPSSTPSFSAACLDESPGLRDGSPRIAWTNARRSAVSRRTRDVPGAEFVDGSPDDFLEFLCLELGHEGKRLRWLPGLVLRIPSIPGQSAGERPRPHGEIKGQGCLSDEGQESLLIPLLRHEAADSGSRGAAQIA